MKQLDAVAGHPSGVVAGIHSLETQFVWQDSPTNPQPRNNALRLSVSAALPYRRIYSYVGITGGNPSGAALTLRFFKQGSFISSLPMFAASGAFVQSGATPTLLVAGGQVALNAIGLFMPDGTTQILQPFSVFSAADEFIVDINSMVGVTNVYLWLGICSLANEC